MFFFALIMYMNAKNGICRRIHFYVEWIVFYLILMNDSNELSPMEPDT